METAKEYFHFPQPKDDPDMILQATMFPLNTF